MLKRSLFILLAICAVSVCAYSETQEALIKDVRGELSVDSAEIVIESNYDIEFLDYILENPFRVVIDPIGKVYSDLKDKINFDEGIVRNVTVIKGRPDETAAGNFYPVDFIVIELDKAHPYKVRREKQEIIVAIGEKKAPAPSAEAAQPLEETPPQEDVAQPIPLEEAAPQKTSSEAAPSPEVAPPVDMAPAEKAASEDKPQEAAPLKDADLGTDDQKVIPLEPPAAEKQTEPVKVVYTIGQGDVLDISVWQHPELDKKVTVRPDGYISFPLAGDVKASSLTPPELASSLKDNLSRLVKEPQVTVIVASFGSKNIFVLGEVMKAGSYPYVGGVNVLNAISDAGGWKKSAVLNSVMLVRKVFTDTPEVRRLDIFALVKKGDFSQNLALEPGDIIYVPKSFIANIGDFIDNLKITIGAYLTNSVKVID